MLPIAVTVVLAAVAGVSTWLWVRSRDADRERDFARAVRARKLGWSYEGNREGSIDYRFAGHVGGIAWQLWFDSDRGSDSPTPSAVWKSANLQTPSLSLVILGRRRFELESGAVGQLLMGVASGIAEAIHGHAAHSDKSAFYETAIRINGGRPSFDERFAVAIAPDMPRDWIDVELQTLMMQWPAVAAPGLRIEDQIEITLAAGGLQILVQKMPEEFACWEHVATIGVHLAQQLHAASQSVSKEATTAGAANL